MQLSDSATRYVMLAAALALLYFLGIFPLVLEIYVSFTNWTPINGNWWQASLLGLSNYLGVLADPLFGWAVARTIFIVAVSVSTEFLIGLALALVFLRNFFGKRVFTSIMILPMMTVPAITGYIFYMIFLGSGPLNGILSLLSGTQVSFQWLQNPLGALFAVIAMDIWQWTPLMFLILLSGLLALPAEPGEAAHVLGASRWQIFRHITLPALKPIIIIALVVRIMESLKLFDGVWIMTRGGPVTATETISVYLYKEGFLFLRYGYIAAASLIILVGLIVFTRWMIRPLRLGD